MNPHTYIFSGSAISSLGLSTREHIGAILDGKSGIRQISRPDLSPDPFFGGIVDTSLPDADFPRSSDYTRFESLLIAAVSKSLKMSPDFDASSSDTLFLISTTKGNIDLLETDKKALFPAGRIHLWKAAEIISRHFGNPNKPLLISNACISGVLAIIYAARLLSSGVYRNAVICGGDIVSEFVVAGFQSFKSLSNGICKPFDVSRDGLNLGEGAACLLMSTHSGHDSSKSCIRVSGGAGSNDANHISGPSRTGEGLFFAVRRAMDEACLPPDAIDFISAHGTATPFNDEMESKAFSLAGLSDVPLNSLKAYFGHTLGGAGILESVITLESMQRNLIFPTLGYSEYGVPEKITVADHLIEKPLKNTIKTASGFGGCNAAVVFSKTPQP
jgi:3-oxoacyl-[acyl-carrier-protein] synthase I